VDPTDLKHHNCNRFDGCFVLLVHAHEKISRRVARKMEQNSK